MLSKHINYDILKNNYFDCKDYLNIFNHYLFKSLIYDHDITNNLIIRVVDNNGSCYLTNSSTILLNKNVFKKECESRQFFLRLQYGQHIPKFMNVINIYNVIKTIGNIGSIL